METRKNPYRPTDGYDEWTAGIKAEWAKEAKRNERAGKKMERAIARGEYKVEGEYFAYGRKHRIVTKTS